MDKKQITDFFDAMASGWDKGQERNEKAIDFILSVAGISRGTRVLDVACGTGILFPDYIDRGAAVTGIDISSAMADKAKEKFPHTEIICGDAETHDFTEKFDTVMIYNAFPHFLNPRQLFENLSSALKDGGRFTVAHGLSEEKLALCHASAAKDVSLPLPSKEKLSQMMSDFFDVDTAISDEEKYIVSGIKKR